MLKTPGPCPMSPTFVQLADMTVEERSQHLSCDHALKINWSGQNMGEPVSMVVILLRLLPCAQSGEAIFAAVLCVFRVQSH